MLNSFELCTENFKFSSFLFFFYKCQYNFIDWVEMCEKLRWGSWYPVTIADEKY